MSPMNPSKGSGANIYKNPQINSIINSFILSPPRNNSTIYNISMNAGKVIIYTDGGSRGNPGPAAVGVVIGDPSTSLREYSEQIGETTNNVAEYKAVLFALKKAKQLFGKDEVKDTNIEIRSDSELLVNQLNGKYKIKNEDLQPLFIEIWNMKQDFAEVDFVQIPREKNQAADRLVNRALDILL